MTALAPAVRRRLGEQGGFSLSEMLVVLVILGIVIGGMTQLFVSASNAELDLNQRYQAQQNARLALDSLRREIHCANKITTDGTTPVTVATSIIVIDLGASCSTGVTSVTWCALQVGTAQRYALWRKTGVVGTCTATGAIKKADYLWKTATPAFTGKVFTAVAAAGSCLRAKLSVDLPVDLKPQSTAQRYELVDDIVLRNTSRGTCP